MAAAGSNYQVIYRNTGAAEGYSGNANTYIDSGMIYSAEIHMVGSPDLFIKNASGSLYVYRNGSSTGVFLDTSNQWNAANFILTSDERLKQNIRPINCSPIDIDYKQFEMIDNPNQLRYGVIAQELEKTNPELIRVNKDGYLSVAYTDLLIKEIDYLKKKVEELEKRIENLEKIH